MIYQGRYEGIEGGNGESREVENSWGRKLRRGLRFVLTAMCCGLSQDGKRECSICLAVKTFGGRRIVSRDTKTFQFWYLGTPGIEMILKVRGMIRWLSSRWCCYLLKVR